MSVVAAAVKLSSVPSSFRPKAIDGHRQRLTFSNDSNWPVSDGLTPTVAMHGQTSGQPHQFDVALSLTLKPATGLDAIEVAVDIDLQQNAGMVSGATGFCRDYTVEAQPAEVEFIDEHIDHPHRIGVRDVIIQALGQ
ncbi:hypothetical protein D9M72_330020 [compost metagenome]